MNRCQNPDCFQPLTTGREAYCSPECERHHLRLINQSLKRRFMDNPYCAHCNRLLTWQYIQSVGRYCRCCQDWYDEQPIRVYRRVGNHVVVTSFPYRWRRQEEVCSSTFLAP